MARQSNDQFVAIITKTFPGLKPSLPETDGRGPPEHFTDDSSKAERDLGIKFRPLEETVVDAVKRLLVLKESLPS